MAATELYIPTMNRAKSDTAAGSFANYCLAGLDSNPDTYETAAITNPTIKIDMDFTGVAIGSLNFAGVWLGPPPSSGWGAGVLTVWSGAAYPGSSRGSVAYSAVTGPQKLLVVANLGPVTDRYWSLVFSGFTVAPKVREIFIGRRIDLTYRWDWGSLVFRRSMARIDELNSGRILSTLQRQNQPKGMIRNYELLPYAEWLLWDTAYKLAMGRHSLIIIADDGASAITGGTVMRFADEALQYSETAYQLYALSVSLLDAPVIGDAEIY